ncbi:MAG TPA: PadR family transcriptional regulator [Spirochaetia bacterium]|nr:PadR family transcriptional regulator [Spirochaetia bacterium]
MSLKHALLGFLNYAPMTGYELKQHFDGSIRHFWNSSLSRIYPMLGEMENEGLVTMEMQVQDGRPNRKVYHMTQAGREELQGWLRTPLDQQPVREPFLIKVFFGANLTKEEILAELRQKLAFHRGLLADYRGPVREGMKENIEATGLKRDGLFWRLTLDAGLKHVTASIEWLEESIRKIEELDE